MVNKIKKKNINQMSSWTFSFVNPWKGGLVLENGCSHMATSFLAFLPSLKQEFTSFPPSHTLSVGIVKLTPYRTLLLPKTVKIKDNVKNPTGLHKCNEEVHGSCNPSIENGNVGPARDSAQRCEYCLAVRGASWCSLWHCHRAPIPSCLLLTNRSRPTNTVALNKCTKHFH